MQTLPAATPPATPAPEEVHELTTAELHAALSSLGHNRNGELVYTRCVLSARHLSRLPGLERYGNLQQLVLDNNALTELPAVQHMPQLVYLSARHNKLTSAVFESLAGAAECLERLHLDDNCLTSLSGLEKLPFITDLTCSHNAIECVPARCLSTAQRLMRLRLDHNRIAAVDVNAFAAARHLRVLELNHNALSSVAFVRSVSAQVERLVLSDNQIAHLDRAMQHVVGLTVLDVRRNVLSGLEELRSLRALSALRVLFFDGNAALAHLPRAYGAASRGGDAAPSAGGRTEYHAEVVMSDEEGDDADGAAVGSSSYTDERSRTVHPCTTPSDGEESGGRPHGMRHTPPPSGGKGIGDSLREGQKPNASIAAAAAAAAPTTASYVALAAPETHDFIRTVGSAARNAELCVKVDKTREILALPEEEQVYLWTLSLLPHLLQLNDRPISPADVARANFLFSPL